VRFKANANRTMPVSFMMNGSPYTWFGGTTANLTTAWQEFSFVVTPSATINNDTRLSFNLGSAIGIVYIDEVTIKEAVPTSFFAGEDLAAKNIQRSNYRQRTLYAP
jgi:hypothetical protein